MIEGVRVRQGDYPGAVQVREDRIRATELDAVAAAAQIESLHDHFGEGDVDGYWRWHRDHGDARLARGERVSHLELATAAVHLGDRAGALDHLEAALRARDRGLASLRDDPTWDTLRRHPRFQSVVEGTQELIQRIRQSVRGAAGGARGDGPPPGPGRRPRSG